MEYYERPKGILTPSDDEVDRDRLAQLTAELDPKQKGNPSFLEFLGSVLKGMGYRYSVAFGMWIRKQTGGIIPGPADFILSVALRWRQGIVYGMPCRAFFTLL